MAAGRYRRLLPVPLPAQCNDKRQNLCLCKEIRLFSQRAKKIESDYFSGSDQPDQQLARLLDRRLWRSGIGCSLTSLNEGWCWRRQLNVTREKKTQRMLLEPALRILKRENRVPVLAPVRRPRGFELICCQKMILLFAFVNCRERRAK